MKKTKSYFPSFILIILVLSAWVFQSENELAATLEVLSPGVEVLRVNTSNWIAVNIEAIVGVGDTIRTNETGRARITFFADGTDTELQPQTEYRILRFEGNPETFSISVEVIAGQTVQRLKRLASPSSSYDIHTPGLDLVARGTAFTVRVEDTGRSGMLVSEGGVDASNETDNAEVPTGFGIRAEVDSVMSDVVRARSFAELDAALDGCQSSIRTVDDVRVNVRIGPDLNFPRVGTLDPVEITRFWGVTESGGWYRILFRGGFGWVLSSSATLEEGCAGLRQFADNYGPEDILLYTTLGDAITLDDLEPIAPPEQTPDATPSN